MSTDGNGSYRSASPQGPGRASPAPQSMRRMIGDGLLKPDKKYRRYAAAIERVLSTWEIHPQEWPDYIAFLGRLLKALQAIPQETQDLPQSAEIAFKLAQCLNPALPSGVHQKALEVYAYIFSTFGNDFVGRNLHHFLPGLSTVLTFASLSVRPILYGLFEDHILPLSSEYLRPALKSLILSLLPALEEDRSEDFERAFTILDNLQRTFTIPDTTGTSITDGYFWQCLFLSIITSSARRQGGLNYLSRRMPKFGRTPGDQLDVHAIKAKPDELIDPNPVAESMISPEPGLLIRCFVCGLQDTHFLVHRGFLDLLVTNLPLHCDVLQKRVGHADLDRLVSAATQVLLRRDMSLNRRLWSWFLGPNTFSEDQLLASPNPNSDVAPNQRQSRRYLYFANFGKLSLERSLLRMFERPGTKASDLVRPFRICTSLMDRGEIGGSLVPSVFLAAIRSFYIYSQNASAEDINEVFRSASLFFDGIEAKSIWANFMRLISEVDLHKAEKSDNLAMFAWVLQHFNIKDEEMQNTHIPLICLYMLSQLVLTGLSSIEPAKFDLFVEILTSLSTAVPWTSLNSTKTSAVHLDVNDDETSGAPDLVHNIMIFYETVDSINPHEAPWEGQFVSFKYECLLSTLIVTSLDRNTPDRLVPLVSLLQALLTKDVQLHEFTWSSICTAIAALFNSARATSSKLSFPVVSSCVTLIAAMFLQNGAEKSADDAAVQSDLIAQVWQYLSPEHPKYHVEAVRLLWQLADVGTSDDSFKATLTAILSHSLDTGSYNAQNAVEAPKHFTVLWAHTVPATASMMRPGLANLTRRGSVGATSVDPKQLRHREWILAEPLMFILDCLHNPGAPSFEVVKTWLLDLPSLERVLRIHFTALTESKAKAHPSSDDSPLATRRRSLEAARECEYFLTHFLQLLRYGGGSVLQCLAEMVVEPGIQGKKSGLISLAELCLGLLCDDLITSQNLTRLTLEILHILLSGTMGYSLRSLDIDNEIMDYLTFWSTRDQIPHHGLLLELLAHSLRIRNATEVAYPVSESRMEDSFGAKRTSNVGSRPTTNTLPTAPTVFGVPARLLNCLRVGFTSKTTRQHLEQWVDLLSSILPLFANGIFSSLIPLVELMCEELDKTYEDLCILAQKDGANIVAAPEADAMALLEALELVLSQSHDSLVKETSAEPTPKMISPPQGLLSNVASGVFKSDVPSGRSAQSNSRLTVILAFQDTIKSSLRIWTWANRVSDSEDFDRNSAATTSFNALRLRNRTRHMLEQIFAAEPLESLEVIIAQWCYHASATNASSMIDLLHAMQGCRPKNVIPAILDALYSRTNHSALPAHRQSSHTVDLTLLDIAMFFSAYIDSVEDDAMDEIWSDCISFWRDVLSNPLPYRQVLPALLSAVLLVAKKIENTNFGEQRKMRRELGDIFQRLLTATFTAIPAGSVTDSGNSMPSGPSRNESNSAQGTRTLSLVPVLVRVLADIETILETSDRITSAVNSISANLIAPLFHSKSFPRNINADVLSLASLSAKKAPNAKTWKKDITDAFNDARLLATPTALMQSHWFPILHRWSSQDKERMAELISRLTPPSIAGIMFGVGASAARLDADRKAQLNLRRICLLLLASPQDSHAVHQRLLGEKVVELFQATNTSSPSSAVKAELFMIYRALILSTSAVQLAGLWPLINEALQSALMALLPKSTSNGTFGNLSLLQACKLLDLLIAIGADDFQLHEWLYICDTIDAVYQPPSWDPSALTDQVIEALAVDVADEEGTAMQPATPVVTNAAGNRRLLLANSSTTDKEDWKAMTQEDFARSVLRPFLGQLSIHAYEGVYSLEPPDMEQCRRALLEDILDLATIVD